MIQQFWRAVLDQDREAIRRYFREDAFVNWHCTNEHFTVEEFIQANCEYPGQWDGEIQRVETVGDTTITVVQVYPPDRSLSCHVVSFLRIQDGLIASVDEYWGGRRPFPGVAAGDAHRQPDPVNACSAFASMKASFRYSGAGE